MAKLYAVRDKSGMFQAYVRASMKRKTDKSAAIITIKSPGTQWLRWHAAHLLKHGKEYTYGRLTGRFVYR